MGIKEIALHTKHRGQLHQLMSLAGDWDQTFHKEGWEICQATEEKQNGPQI